ncbi:MAG: hypothetical protein IH852_17435 [Bacteroidetes bacterium]|nr:hypothetical protein [Bacteroidota bacterium]
MNKFIIIYLLSLMMVNSYGQEQTHSQYDFISYLYEYSDLEYWQDQYSENVRWNFRNVIFENLTRDERKFIGYVDMELPLLNKGGCEPFSFSYSINEGIIIAPIIAIKFFDDLSIAHSWLLKNGYATNTINVYTLMLKYLNPTKDDRWPPPLSVLGIPDNWKDDPEVDNISQNNLKNIVVFEIAHQLGHIYQGDDAQINKSYTQQVNDAYTQKVNDAYTRKVNDEINADYFAVELFRRLGIPPTGIDQYFLIQSILAPNPYEFNKTSDYEDFVLNNICHPITSERLNSLASELESKLYEFIRFEKESIGIMYELIEQLRWAIGVFEDAEIAALKENIKSFNISDLKPQRMEQMRK